ncbi:hypothetical protein E2C01_063151 [Portunus trituberculatus]|uniref:Uncharacterized protein n=1 Tax=Portunus trituberculatus TaxID=210409 RepID=A0A5B7HGR1_PORTR|nr:hypothetical protein [Portunus trituberculatus]
MSRRLKKKRKRRTQSSKEGKLEQLPNMNYPVNVSQYPRATIVVLRRSVALRGEEGAGGHSVQPIS